MSKSNLNKAFSFTSADLYANQQGHFTERQKNRLWQMSIGASIIPGIFLVGAIALFSRTLEDFNRVHQPGNLRLNVLGSGMLVLICLIFGVWRLARIVSDVLIADVRTIEGEIALGAMQTRNIGYYGTGCRATVNNISFIIPWNARSALIEGGSYRLYFTPKAKIILSIKRS